MAIMIRKVVNLIILNSKKEILLAKRKDRYSGWSIPGGGIEKNESNLKALKREINEELGCKIKQAVEFKDYEYLVEKDFLIQAKYFYGALSGKIKVKEELSEYKWVKANQVSRMKFAFNQKQVIKDFVEFYYEN